MNYSTAQKNQLIAVGLKSDIEDLIFESLDGGDINQITFQIKLRGIKPRAVKIAYPMVEKLVKEFGMIGSDPDVTEAYSFLDSDQIKKIKKFGRDALLQLRALSQTRRKAKAKASTLKAIENVKFQKGDTSLGLAGIEPAEVVGKTALVIYDTKRRQLGIFQAKAGEFLEFKGTTLQNFDPEKSFSKTLRQPKDILPKVATGNLIRILVILETVKAKEQQLTGRTRDEMILINAF